MTIVLRLIFPHCDPVVGRNHHRKMHLNVHPIESNTVKMDKKLFMGHWKNIWHFPHVQSTGAIGGLCFPLVISSYSQHGLASYYDVIFTRCFLISWNLAAKKLIYLAIYESHSKVQ